MRQDKEETIGSGRNRTGLTTHLEQSRELIAAARSSEPSSPGDASTLAVQRLEWAKQMAPGGVGSMPDPPGKLPADDAARGPDLVLLLDKLGERLQFERTGVRLYEALLTKRLQYEARAGEPADGVAALPPVAELSRIRDDKRAHFALLQETILELGGDPTVVTPCANIVAVIGQGLVQVLTDPRTDVMQGLQAVLAAELQDNDGWRLLIALAQLAMPNRVPALRDALSAEDRHLEQVRTWLFQWLTQPAVY